MVRTQVYFDQKEYDAVRESSFKRKVSISAVIRELVDKELLGQKSSSGKKSAAGEILALSKLIRAKAHDKKKDVSQRHDDYLWGDGS